MRKAIVPVVASAAIGLAGLSLIQASEGLRFKTYRDPVGIPTVCYGHTGPDVKLGQTYTRKQCDDILMADIRSHQPVILPGNPRNCTGDALLTPNERDALTDFIINVGPARFCRSSMAKKLKARNFAGVASEFPKWEYAGGKKLPGLTKRRTCERLLYVSDHRSDARDVLSLRAKGCLTT